MIGICSAVIEKQHLMHGNDSIGGKVKPFGTYLFGLRVLTIIIAAPSEKVNCDPRITPQSVTVNFSKIFDRIQCSMLNM